MQRHQYHSPAQRERGHATHDIHDLGRRIRHVHLKHIFIPLERVYGYTVQFWINEN